MLGPRFPGRQVRGLWLKGKETRSPANPQQATSLPPSIGADKAAKVVRHHGLGDLNWGNWDVAANWVNEANSGHRHVPTATDDAVIPALASGNALAQYGRNGHHSEPCLEE